MKHVYTPTHYPISFGSTPIPDPLALTHTIVEAARLTGTRILLAPLSPIPAFPFSPLPPHVFLLPPDAPAPALLPYTCAVLHAGEAQLTAAVLRAGRPSVVVPCVGDQSFWAWALHRAGAAARPIEKASVLGGGKAKDMGKGALVLKEAIEVALSEQIVDNAKIIGDRIGREVSRLLFLSRQEHAPDICPCSDSVERHGSWCSFLPSASAPVKYAV